jgi:hypothetical protein
MNKWGKNINKAFKEIKGMDWIQLAKGRVRWWEVVNMVMKVLSAIHLENFLKELLSAFHNDTSL